MKKILIFLQRCIDYIWSLFLNGLLTILPIVLTLAIFNVTFKLLKSWLEPIGQLCPSYFLCIPHAEIFLAIIIIFLFGTIIKVFMVRSLVHTIESLVLRLPIIRTVYRGVQQLVKAFNPQDQMSFKEVVLLEFPRKGVYSIGFLTTQMPPELAPDQEEPYVNIFVPTTPMPTSGFFVIIQKSKVRHTGLTHQEAIAMIISGGIIRPERFSE